MRHHLLSSPSPPILHPPSPPPSSPATTTLHTHRHHLTYKLSRRDLTAATFTALPLLLRPSPTRADDAVSSSPTSVDLCSSTNIPTTKTAFLDVSIDGEPAGRITIGLYTETSPLGAARFASLLSGAAGISYRRKDFVKITPNYVQHGGVRSYGADAEVARRTGGSELAADGLMAEWEAAAAAGCRARSVAGTVGLVVRDPARPPPKVKLVARNGRLEVDEEEVGVEPNGTEFIIAVRDSPELDAAALVVGRVVAGWDVVERIAKVKTVQENTGSPYFRVAKLIGDKRAVVAERGFNRPYSKVVVANCGLIP